MRDCKLRNGDNDRLDESVSRTANATVRLIAFSRRTCELGAKGSAQFEQSR